MENGVSTSIDKTKNEIIHQTKKYIMPSSIMNGESAHMHTLDQLSKMGDNDLCVVFVIDISNKIQNKASNAHYDEIRKRADGIVSSLFYASDIVSSIGYGEYFIFAKWDAGRKEVESKAELICEKLSFVTKTEPALSVSACVGAYIASGKDITFEELFGKAAVALYEARSSGPSSYCIMTDEPERERSDSENVARIVNGISLNTLLKYLDSGIALIEAGPEIRLIYASSEYYKIAGLDEKSCVLPCGSDSLGIYSGDWRGYELAVRKAAETKNVEEHIHKIMVGENKWIWRHIKLVRVFYPTSKYPVLLEISTDISELINTQSELKESHDRLRVAFHQTPNVIWEVDIGTGIYSTYDVDEHRCNPETTISGFPQSFIDKGIIHPYSAESFRQFADGIINGKTGDSGNFIMRDFANNCYGWVSLSYKMVCDRGGMPFKAVGLQMKLPGVSGISPSLASRRPLPDIIWRHMLVRMKVNLTADYVDEVWIGGVDRTAWTWGKTYTEILAKAHMRMYNDSERRRLCERFDRNNMLKAYDNGELWSSQQYLRIDRGGHIRHVEDTVNLEYDSKTDSVYMFACFMDVQDRYELERKMDDGVFYDHISRIYDYETARNMSEYIIRNNKNMPFAVSLIKIIGGSEEKAEKKDIEEIYRFIPKALSLPLGVGCVLGQYKPDTVYAFFPGMSSKFEIKRRIEDSFAYIRAAMSDLPIINSVRMVAGTIAMETDNVDHDTILRCAEYLCDMWRNAAMDMVAFPDDNEDWAWIECEADDTGDRIGVEACEYHDTLTNDEQKAAFKCVTGMLKADSAEKAVINALGGIGGFYSAARVYILETAKDGKTISMKYEWTKPGRHSIYQAMIGAKLSSIPVLSKCIEQDAPVFMESNSLTFQNGKNNLKWHFIVYPLKKQDKIKGFLCVEDAQEHFRERALLDILVPYISRENRRFENGQGNNSVSRNDYLFSLPNLKEYTDMVHKITSDVYSSMGALAVDIPEISSINSTKGFEYGKELMLFITDLIISIFGKSFLFRTWDAEFVVLFPNTLQNIFAGRCERFRKAVQSRYPGKARVGYTWAEESFKARDLVREAKVIMRSQSLKDITENISGDDSNIYMSTITSEYQSFVPYFQPKIDMRNGKLIGAEALARGITEDGRIVPPGSFIEEFEKDGSIRDFDLYMVDSVLRQLSAWQRKGIPLVKVSINISRITLFNITTLASILAIQSRYPDIPPDQIELEITETACNMEKTTLADIVGQFRECGLEFELDDFGTGYANLSVFSNIKFFAIKLDRSIVNDLTENKISHMLINNIIKICRSNNIQCIAEGVETRQQEKALLNAGCICGQGYYYSKPLSASEFESRYLERKSVK